LSRDLKGETIFDFDTYSLNVFIIDNYNKVDLDINDNFKNNFFAPAFTLISFFNQAYYSFQTFSISKLNKEHNLTDNMLTDTKNFYIIFDKVNNKLCGILDFKLYNVNNPDIKKSYLKYQKQSCIFILLVSYHKLSQKS
jgi:hypothetical protein